MRANAICRYSIEIHEPAAFEWVSLLAESGSASVAMPQMLPFYMTCGLEMFVEKGNRRAHMSPREFSFVRLHSTRSWGRNFVQSLSEGAR